MWIAKPITSLSSSDIASWRQIERKVPLAQTLSWARATEAVSGKAFLVFSPDEGVGGIVWCASSFFKEDANLHFECINGPSLDWNHPLSAPRQLATFAMAVSKLDNRFKSLSIKPRWDASERIKRLELLPIPEFKRSQAATILIPIQKSKELQFSALSPRLRRTLSLALQNQIKTKCEKLSQENLKQFLPQMSLFGKKCGFTVPPLVWFEALIKDKSELFWLISCSKEENGELQSLTQLVICMHEDRAYYLFGYENRVPTLRSAISTSALAHWEALCLCAKQGIQTYDLNGFLVELNATHPYSGVSQFKKQFNGQIIHYEVPEFLIK